MRVTKASLLFLSSIALFSSVCGKETPSWSYGEGDFSDAKTIFCNGSIKSFDQLQLTKKESDAIYKYVHTVSGASLAGLVWKKRETDKLQKIIRPVHPLKFISYIIRNPKLRTDLQEIQRNYLKWSQFMEDVRRRMTEEYYKGNLHDYVPGFCESINVKTDVVQHFVNRKDWEGLIKAIM